MRILLMALGYLLLTLEAQATRVVGNTLYLDDDTQPTQARFLGDGKPLEVVEDYNHNSKYQCEIQALIKALDKHPNDKEHLYRVLESTKYDNEILARVGCYYALLPEEAAQSDNTYKVNNEITADARGLYLLYESYTKGETTEKWQYFQLAHLLIIFQKLAKTELNIEDPALWALDIYEEWHRKHGMQGEDEIEANAVFCFQVSRLMQIRYNEKRFVDFLVKYSPQENLDDSIYDEPKKEVNGWSIGALLPVALLAPIAYLMTKK